MKTRGLILTAMLVITATTASAAPMMIGAVETDSIDEHARGLAKFTFDSIRGRVFGLNLEEMLMDYALRFKWGNEADVVIEHFPAEINTMPDHYGLIDIEGAFEILDMPLLEYTEEDITQIKEHLVAILKLGGKIGYTTSGGMACEEQWPSVLIIDSFKKVITELVTVHVDC